MKPFRVSRNVAAVMAAALLVVSSVDLRAGDVGSPLLDSDLPGAVYEAGPVDQAAAEALFTSAEAAVYFPDLQRVRWFEMQGGSTSPRGLMLKASGVTKSLADFGLDLECDFPSFRSNRYGPYLLKLPARATLLHSATPASGSVISPTATAFTDSFENGLSQWQLADNTNGDYSFTVMGCQKHSGNWSADAVRGGNKGQYAACWDTYPANVTTQITHSSCDSIQGAAQAWLDFYFTADMDNSEVIGAYYLGPDNYIWGYQFVGSWSGWFHIVLNLKQWYHLGDLTTASCPRTMFQFRSDGSNTVGTGVFIDDVTIRTDAPPFLQCSIAATPISGPAPLAVSFVPSVTGASGTATYEWRFGDAASTVSTTQNSVFTYTATGEYWPRLRVTDSSGTRAYAQTKILVTAGGTCSLSCAATVPAAAKPGTPVSFSATATTSGCSGSPAFAWSFGDGQTSAQQNPSHTYASAGTYTWTLTATAGGATCTKSGSIAIAAASTGNKKRRAVSPPPATSSGTDVLVAPSPSAQTVRYGGASITIPGGMLTASQHVKVSAVAHPPASSMKYLQQMGAYEIQIGDLHNLPGEVTLRMKYDPAAIRKDMPVGRAVAVSYWSSDQGLWVRMPADIDTANSEIVVKTRHLSLFSWAMVKLGYSVFFKNNFYIIYDKAELNLPANVAWYTNPDTSNYADPDVPDYVEDVMAFLIEGYRRYMTDTKFTAPPTPIDVYVGSDMSPFTEKFSGLILISLLAKNPNQLKMFTAHELFHRVQNAYYYDIGGMLWLKWWLEATADYAGDQVAWGGLQLMGNAITRNYLAAPLTDSGTAHNEGYSTSHFVKYLVDTGCNFKAMWDATANPSWFDSFSFLDGLTTYLMTVHGTSSGLGKQYQNFARYFVFDPASPMPAIDDSLHSQVAAYRSTLTSGGESATFSLEGGYTAKVWGVWFSDSLFDAATPKIKYTVSIDGTLPARVEADVYLLKGDKRVAGSVPAGTLSQTLKKVDVEVQKGDAVYVLAVNTDSSAQQVKVRISGNEFSQISIGQTTYTFLCIPGKDCKGEWCGVKPSSGTAPYAGPLTWTGDSFTLTGQGTRMSGQLSADQKTLLSFTYDWLDGNRAIMKWVNLPLDNARSTPDQLVFAVSGEAARNSVVTADPLICESNHAGIDYTQPVKLEIWLSR